MARAAILLCLLLAGCVTTEVGPDGQPIERGRSDTLVLDTAGRIVARPTLLIAPHTIIINGGTPTEREIRLLGVEGLPKELAPTTFAKTQEWMATYLSREEQIFIRPALDTDLESPVIYGVVYIQAYLRDRTGNLAPVPDGYLCVNQAMAAEGLVRIREARELEDPGLRDRIVRAEQHAKDRRLGLWGDSP